MKRNDIGKMARSLANSNRLSPSPQPSLPFGGEGRLTEAGSQETFTIRVESRFEAAHNLREYYGKPEKLHGHSWKVEAKIEARRLDTEDISVDYVKVQHTLDELAKKLDHNYINEVPPFDRVNPTSENIARWFYEEINRKEVLGTGYLKEICIWEGPFHSCSYTCKVAQSQNSKLRAQSAKPSPKIQN